MAFDVIYNIATVYTLNATGAIANLNTLNAAMGRTQVVAGATHAAVLRLNSSFSLLLRFAGFSSLAFAAFEGFYQVFNNLNNAMNRTVTIAQQLNLNFEYAKNPVDNWRISMEEADKMVQRLAQDVTKLPGVPQEYFSILGKVSGPTFAAGGGPEQALAITRGVGILAFKGAAGIRDPETAAREAQMILEGGIRKQNPLYRYLAGQQALPSPKIMNEETPALRLQQFAEALQKVTGNTEYLTALMHTFHTQWSTLYQQIFDVNGILYIVGQGPFNWLIDAMTDLNVAIATNKITIINDLLEIGGSIMAFGGVLKAFEDMLPKSDKKTHHIQDTIHEFEMINAIITTFGQVMNSRWSSGLWTSPEKVMNLFYENLGKAEQETHKYDYTPKTLDEFIKAQHKHDQLYTNQQITNHIGPIHIDYKSDDSPEAVALKVVTALEMAVRHSTSSRRSPLLLPVPGSS